MKRQMCSLLLTTIKARCAHVSRKLNSDGPKTCSEWPLAPPSAPRTALELDPNVRLRSGIGLRARFRVELDPQKFQSTARWRSGRRRRHDIALIDAPVASDIGIKPVPPGNCSAESARLIACTGRFTHPKLVGKRRRVQERGNRGGPS